MTDVMKKACNRDVGMILTGESEPGSQGMGQVHGPQRVLKPGMMCARIDEK
jgi:hypothetical protein